MKKNTPAYDLTFYLFLHFICCQNYIDVFNADLNTGSNFAKGVSGNSLGRVIYLIILLVPPRNKLKIRHTVTFVVPTLSEIEVFHGRKYENIVEN